MSSVDEPQDLALDEMADLFVERNGRVYSASTTPYPLPVDLREQHRMNVQHQLLRTVIGANFVGDLPGEVLTREPGRLKVIVDVGCGTGTWVLQMAAQFPTAYIVGLDIAPVAPEDHPDNVSFETHDINERTRFGDGTVDFVHARFCAMTVRDYNRIIREASRILRPGGVFVFGEWLRQPMFTPTVNLSPLAEVPEFCRFTGLLNERLRLHGLQHISDSIPVRLGQARTFTEITPLRFFIPIGSWHPNENMRSVGRAYRGCIKRFMDAVKPFILELDITEAEYDRICAAAKVEISHANSPPLVSHYFSGYAVRA
ncbi:S-adenosyl-L-methionine-dependent methyltransferase [Hymenopellis radicata]|nr:S-adenosyl-L-methionine-dependent methyltransferase [Hymenopellis radicata]